MLNIEASNKVCIVGCGDIGSKLIGELPQEQAFHSFAVSLEWGGPAPAPSPRNYRYIDLGDSGAPRALFDPTDEYLFSHARKTVDKQIDQVLDAIGQATTVLLMGMAGGSTAAGILLGLAQNLLIRGIPTAVTLGMPAFFEGMYKQRRAEDLFERLTIGNHPTTRVDFTRTDFQGLGFLEALRHMDDRVLDATRAMALRLADSTPNWRGIQK